MFKVLEVESQKIWPLDSVKKHLRISHNYDDTVINDLVLSAIEIAENFTGLSLLNRKITFIGKCSAKGHISLKYKPVKAVIRVAGVKNSKFVEDMKDGYSCDEVAGKFWIHKDIAAEELYIEYSTGFVVEHFPVAIKHGILLHVSEMYDMQSSGSLTLSKEVRELYFAYKNIRL